MNDETAELPEESKQTHMIDTSGNNTVKQVPQHSN